MAAAVHQGAQMHLGTADSHDTPYAVSASCELHVRGVQPGMLNCRLVLDSKPACSACSCRRAMHASTTCRPIHHIIYYTYK